MGDLVDATKVNTESMGSVPLPYYHDRRVCGGDDGDRRVTDSCSLGDGDFLALLYVLEFRGFEQEIASRSYVVAANTPLVIRTHILIQPFYWLFFYISSGPARLRDSTVVEYRKLVSSAFCLCSWISSCSRRR